MLIKSPLVDLLFEAVGSDHGLIVRCESATLLRTKLYPIRKREEVFTDLSFILSPDKPDTDLWIVKLKRAAE